MFPHHRERSRITPSAAEECVLAGAAAWVTVACRPRLFYGRVNKYGNIRRNIIFTVLSGLEFSV